MDPNATWKLLLVALCSQQWRDVRDHADDLLDWLEQGGFPPETSNGLFNDPFWNKQLARYACRLAKQIARRGRRTPTKE